MVPFKLLKNRLVWLSVIKTVCYILKNTTIKSKRKGGSYHIDIANAHLGHIHIIRSDDEMDIFIGPDNNEGGVTGGTY